MYAQQFKNQSTLSDFLERIDYDKIYELPCDNKQLIVATHARNLAKSKLKGITLLNWNIKREAKRLRINDQTIIPLATEYIWRINLTSSQRDRFKTLANNANDINNRASKINNTDTIDRIIRINSPQETDNLSEKNFFNGTKFNDVNDNFDFLTLPSGIQYDHHSSDQIFRII
jgi:hypothetical protein